MSAFTYDGDPFELLKAMESAGQDVTPVRASPRIVSVEVLHLITEGYGDKIFDRLPAINSILEMTFRYHNWRYQNGCCQYDRLRADALLLGHGFIACLMAQVGCMGWRGIIFAMPAFIILYIYFGVSVFTGWFTCTLFRLDGGRLAAHPRIEAMAYRAIMRQNDLNPGASHCERGLGNVAT